MMKFNTSTLRTLGARTTRGSYTKLACMAGQRSQLVAKRVASLLNVELRLDDTMYLVVYDVEADVVESANKNGNSMSTAEFDMFNTLLRGLVDDTIFYV